MQQITDLIEMLVQYPHILPLSYSKGNILLTCPWQYKQRYIDKAATSEAPHKEVMVVGKFVHKVLELCVNKGQSFGWESDAIDFDKTWMQVMKQVPLSPNEYNMSEDIRIHTENVFERLLTAIKSYNWIVTPELMICMDKKANVRPGVKWIQRFFYGFIDFYAETVSRKRAVVIDYKSHAQTTDNDAKAQLQLKNYVYYLFLRNPSIESLQFGGAYLPDENIALSPQIFRGEDEHQQICEEVFEFYSRILEQLKTETFNPVESKFCEWCGYTHSCPLLTN